MIDSHGHIGVDGINPQDIVEGHDPQVLRSLPRRPEDFDQLDEPLIEAGAMRVGRIGDAEIRWMRSRDLFSVVRRVYGAGIATPTRLALTPLSSVPWPAPFPPPGSPAAPSAPCSGRRRW